jgi:dethiobiotin synthetase
VVIVVVGTGTDVGKTHVTAALARATAGSAWKPVTSGGDEDVVRLGSAPPLFSLSLPISPHLAARRDGVVVDVAAIVRAIAERKPSFVETAGGLYTPLTDRETNADLVRAISEPKKVILVAPDRLGVLHDVGAVLRAAGVDGIVFECIALSAPANADASTGTNAAEIVRLGLAERVVGFPRAAVDDVTTLDAARALVT